MSKFYVSGIIALIILLSGCGVQNPVISTTTPENNLEGNSNLPQNNTENSAYEDWNTFVNPNGSYGFLYPPTWNAAINIYDNNFTLFGQGATGQSGTGGIEIKENYSIKSYLDFMENDVGVKHVVIKNVKIDGIDGVRVEYNGYRIKGHAVVLKKDNNIYNLYFNSNSAEDVELFDKLSETFVFSE